MLPRIVLVGLVLALSCPHGAILAQTPNPFGLTDVVNPDGDDVAAFAATVFLSKDSSDPNAQRWTNISSRGLAGYPDGKWASRWYGASSPDKSVTGEATIVSSGDRVYIYYKDANSSYLIDTRREGSRLTGRYTNTNDPTDWSPWVGEIVSDERIDGVWNSGRWDLRRRMTPLLTRKPRPAPPPADGRGLSFAQQIGHARELLRGGKPKEAAEMVRASISSSRLPDSGDARDRSFARALVAFADGKPRAAFDHAEAIHAAAKAGHVNVDAALIKSLVCLQEGVLPLAAHWRDWAAKSQNSVAGDGIGELLASKNGTGATYSLSQSVPHNVAGYSIDIWHGDGDALQPVVLTLQKKGDFRGAFALEGPGVGSVPMYILKYYDLEGEPFLLTYYGSEQPTDDELIELAGQFDPRPTKQGHGLARAELKALFWERAGIAPFAAQWAARAAGSQLVADTVEKPLKESHRWQWTYRGKQEWLADSATRLELHSYVNAEFPNLDRSAQATGHAETSTVLRDKGPLEHVCITISDPASTKYLGSVVFESSEPLSGVRLYYLSSIIDGQRRRLRRYDSPLALTEIVDQAKQALADKTGGYQGVRLSSAK